MNEGRDYIDDSVFSDRIRADNPPVRTCVVIEVSGDVCVGSVTSSDSGHSTQLDSHSGSSVEAGGSPPPPQRRHSALQGM